MSLLQHVTIFIYFFHCVSLKEESAFYLSILLPVYKRRFFSSIKNAAKIIILQIFSCMWTRVLTLHIWNECTGSEDTFNFIVEYPLYLEEGTATHSSIVAWRIPWTEEPGGLQSMGFQRVGHDWSYLSTAQHAHYQLYCPWLCWFSLLYISYSIIFWLYFFMILSCCIFGCIFFSFSKYSVHMCKGWEVGFYYFLIQSLEKEMATHSSVFAWRIPGTGEPGGLPSMGSHRVRHDWSDLAAAAIQS